MATLSRLRRWVDTDSRHILLELLIRLRDGDQVGRHGLDDCSRYTT